MTAPSNEAIAQAFREYDEGDIVQLRMILARARELDAEKGGDAVEVEWRWVDELGRVMTNWSAGYPPPMDTLTDAKGTMRVEMRPVHATPPAQAAEAVAEAIVERLWRAENRDQIRAAIAAMQAGEAGQ